MYNEIMDFFGLNKEFQSAGYFETEHYQRTLEDVKAAIPSGGLIAITGVIGIGKTITLRLIQSALLKEKEILIAKSLSVEKDRVTLGTLITALFADLVPNPNKNFKVPTQAEKRERTLQDLIRKSRKPIALFIDEAHDLNGHTLVGLKRLVEVVQDGEGILSVILVGHPKLRNDLRRPSMEEIGSRTRIFSLNGIQGFEKQYIEWVLTKCSKSAIKPTDIFSEEAINLLAERLVTPLQIGYYAWQSLEDAYQIGQKPVSVEVVENVLSPDINDLEAKLTRYGYNKRALCNALSAPMSEVNSFLHGQISSERAQEFQKEIQKLGVV